MSTGNDPEGYVATDAPTVASLCRRRRASNQPVILAFEQFHSEAVGEQDPTTSNPNRRLLHAEVYDSITFGTNSRPTLLLETDDGERYMWTRGSQFTDLTFSLPDDLEDLRTLDEYESILGRETSQNKEYEPVGVYVAFYVPENPDVHFWDEGETRH